MEKWIEVERPLTGSKLSIKIIPNGQDDSECKDIMQAWLNIKMPGWDFVCVLLENPNEEELKE